MPVFDNYQPMDEGRLCQWSSLGGGIKNRSRCLCELRVFGARNNRVTGQTRSYGIPRPRGGPALSGPKERASKFRNPFNLGGHDGACPSTPSERVHPSTHFARTRRSVSLHPRNPSNPWSENQAHEARTGIFIVIRRSLDRRHRVGQNHRRNRRRACLETPKLPIPPQ